jgi:hypothetical protein
MRIRIMRGNLENWPSFNRIHGEGKVQFDRVGRLRYPHGAPVGDMLLASVNKDGKAIYKESAEEWFDPHSPKAMSFEWP